MEAEKFAKLIEKLKKEVETEVNDRLPRKIGVMAKNHFTQNFRDSGFRNGGLMPWQKSQRQSGKGTDARYDTLLSRRSHLMRSTRAVPGRGEVTIENPVPYATLHNEGGTLNTHPTITPKMRKMAWAKMYSIAGVKKGRKLPKDLPPEAQKWRALALTKKRRLNITAKMPKRQFIGESAELTEKINQEISQTLQRISDGITRLTHR